MRRSKQNTEYWHKRTDELLKEFPEMGEVKNRYKALRILLQKDYPLVVQSVSKDTLEEFIKDSDYLGRMLRQKTEDKEIEEKDRAELEKLKELGYL